MSQSEVIYKSVPISVNQSIGDFEAIAIYDNQSESPDELNFKKGNVLKILEKDFNGLTGWWLCALNDKIGLAPGNRLEIIGAAPEKPQNVRNLDNIHKGKISDEVSKLAYSLYDVPKISYGQQANQQQQHQQKQQQQESDKLQEIPDILKGQNVTVQNNSNTNQILYNGPAKTAQPLEEITTVHNNTTTTNNNNNNNHNHNNGYEIPDGFVKTDDSSLTPGVRNMYINAPTSNGTFPNGKLSHDSGIRNAQKTSPTFNVSTYSNLIQPLTAINIAQFQQPQIVYHTSVDDDFQQALKRNKPLISSDSDNYDNYDNIITPLLPILPNGHPKPAKENNATITATTDNSLNNNGNGIGNKSQSTINIQYYDNPFKGSQTLQHRPKKPAAEEKIMARDDSDLQTKYKNDTNAKRDRSLRRVRFADQVTSSDTEEWAKNNDPFSNLNAVPLKPILTTSNQNKSGVNANFTNGQGHSNRGIVSANNNNNNNGFGAINDFSSKPNNNQSFYQDDVPDYENPYTEIADQPIYERPPMAYISTSSKLNADNSKQPGKCYTSEFTTVLNTRDAGNTENGNNSAVPYKNQVVVNTVNQLHPPSMQKKFEGVYISSPASTTESEPKFQLRFVDLPKKDQDTIVKSDDGSVKFSPELLNKSREKIQIMANSLDGILNRRNVEDANIATFILKSIDNELQFLVNVGERGLKKSIETWSEDLIEALLQYVEDLRTIQGTLSILNKQIQELSRDMNNAQYCYNFETICSSCALSGRNICHPVNKFIAYVMPKFKFLFPISFNDVGRLAPSPTFNTNPTPTFNTMTRNQLKGKIPESLTYSSLKIVPNILNPSKNLPIGRAPSPIPKIESVPSYNGNNTPKEAVYYEDIPFIQSMRQSTSSDVGLNNKLDGKHLGQTQIHESRNNSNNNLGIRSGPPSFSSLPSQAMQSRPLPPAPPPSYSSVVAQASHYMPQPSLLVRETTQPLPLSAQMHPNFSRIQIRESPAVNNSQNNIYNGFNNNNDSA